ncbi:transketolase [Microbispora triticiradicis]|uniref:Transketolase n=3 Tax=Microbispora TaxID=2005 RepID=A0ABY3M2X0_9ACTN|nr:MULTISPECIES: transketolase [Microbispora]RGA03158.1 transketolase [Microbispora triticiradicis]TLP54056.1 transketolase [Microbispora fusca]TYB65089.1 transketolase [Microbispora tritici]GLW24866.1 transketolase, N-terminal subunit [Microbispora amethystogenes]
MTVETVARSPEGAVDPAALSRTALAVREHVLAIGAGAVGTHIGGSLSAADILVALYFEVLRVRPQEPRWSGRDYFVLSKGHASAALYSTLAERGFFPRSELASYGHPDGRLMAHPTPAVPGVEFATGSLGHGLSLAVGLALAAKRAGRANRVFVLLGDGELQEGTVWEAAMSAAHYRLDNLTAVIDRNRLQINGSTEDRMRLEPLADRWRAFGWQVSHADGHDFAELVPALRTPPAPGGPAVLIADTVKGRGVRHLEHRKQSHFAKLGPDAYERALAALRAAA